MPPAIIPLARFGLPVANPYNWRFHVQGSEMTTPTQISTTEISGSAHVSRPGSGRDRRMFLRQCGFVERPSHHQARCWP